MMYNFNAFLQSSFKMFSIQIVFNISPPYEYYSHYVLVELYIWIELTLAIVLAIKKDFKMPV